MSSYIVPLQPFQPYTQTYTCNNLWSDAIEYHLHQQQYSQTSCQSTIHCASREKAERSVKNAITIYKKGNMINKMVAMYKSVQVETPHFQSLCWQPQMQALLLHIIATQALLWVLKDVRHCKCQPCPHFAACTPLPVDAISMLHDPLQTPCSSHQSSWPMLPTPPPTLHWKRKSWHSLARKTYLCSFSFRIPCSACYESWKIMQSWRCSSNSWSERRDCKRLWFWNALDLDGRKHVMEMHAMAPLPLPSMKLLSGVHILWELHMLQLRALELP